MTEDAETEVAETEPHVEASPHAAEAPATEEAHAADGPPVSEVAPAVIEPDATAATAQTKKWWSLAVKVVSATVATVGAVTGLISILPILFPDSSSLATLTLSASPDDSGPREYALSLAEIDNGFPAADAACSAEQLAWLDDHAVPLHRTFMLDMRNNAGNGPMLALIDFRVDGEPRTDRPTDILVTCPTDPAATVVRAASLLADEEEATARFRALPGTAQAVPDVPVSWNLAPGETGRFQIQLSGSRATVGRLVVTALIGDDEQTVAIEGSAFELPGLWQSGAGYLRVGPAGFECVREELGAVEACTDAELIDLASARDAAYARS